MLLRLLLRLLLRVLLRVRVLVLLLTSTSWEEADAIRDSSTRAIAPLRLQPLARRPTHIPLLATFLLQAARCDLPITTAAMSILVRRSWPRNLAELESVLLAAAGNAHADRSQRIGPHHLRVGDVSLAKPHA